MKIVKSKFVITIILLTILAVIPQVYAKTSIEIKPNSSTVYTNKTISEFFDESLAMKKVGEGLDGDNVDVHMAKNTEWAIVAYFSNSAYGTNGEGKNTGITTSINGTNYLSTNGNATGVMDFGKTYTYTAGVISNYEDIVDSSETAEPYDYGRSIIENVSNRQYVDILENSSECIKSIAGRGWDRGTASIGNSTEYPYTVRTGLSWLISGAGLSWLGFPTGAAKTIYTFRPVIYN